MKKLGIFVTARLVSTRLERKHLLDVEGLPIIGYLFKRIKREFDADVREGSAVICLTTGNAADNRAFAEAGLDVPLFYGDDDNIPLRHQQAALALGVDGIVSVDGDDVLCSRQAMRLVAASLRQGNEYVATRGLPLGLNAWGYSSRMLGEALAGTQARVLETGWGRVFPAERRRNIDLPNLDDARLRFTLDYAEDFHFFSRIITHFGASLADVSDADLIAWVLSERVYEANVARVDEYWRNFNAKKQQE